MWLASRVRKGSGDCGNHEWYKADDSRDECYHCEVGTRSPSEFRPSAEVDVEISRLLRDEERP
jgi:hypothetical protein